jgi:hypothetical protein
MKYYRIRVNGTGGDFRIATTTKEKYDFWNDLEMLRKAGFEDPDFEYGNSALADYLHEKSVLNPEEGRVTQYSVPVEAEFDVCYWDELDDIALLLGVTLESAYMIIEEVDRNDRYGVNVLATVWEGPVTEFLKQQNRDVIKCDTFVKDPNGGYKQIKCASPIMDREGNVPEYIFYGWEVMKGQFFNVGIATETEIDLGIINFYTRHYTPGENFIIVVEYTVSEDMEDDDENPDIDVFHKGLITDILKYDSNQ